MNKRVPGLHGSARHRGWATGYCSSVAMIGLAASLAVSEAFAQPSADSDEISDLKKKVAAQEKIIQELLEWKQKTEKAPPAATRQFESPEEHPPPSNAANADHELRLAELEDKTARFEEQSKVRPTLSGFYDFRFKKEFQSEEHSSFDAHEFGLFVGADIAPFRFYSETSFRHGPRIETEDGGDVEARGVIEVEQMWGEWNYGEWFNARAGLVRLPNYWNINHYPHQTLTVDAPLIWTLDESVLPENLTGVSTYGARYWGDFGISYTAQVGNSSNPLRTDSDDDNESKFFGGMLAFHLPLRRFFDKADVGAVGYADTPAGSPPVRIWGAEMQLRKGRFELVSEYVRRTGDGNQLGFYVQPSWRLSDRWAVVGRLDYLRTPEDRLRKTSAGVNFKPLPAVTLKLELEHDEQEMQRAYWEADFSFSLLF